MASHHYAGQNRMSFCACFGAIAAIGFADNHTWSQLALGQIIGGIQAIHIQEAQQMWSMLAQTSGKTEIVPVFQITVLGEQGIQFSLQGLGTLGKGGWIQLGFLCFQSQGSAQKGGQLLSKTNRRTCLASIEK